MTDTRDENKNQWSEWKPDWGFKSKKKKAKKEKEKKLTSKNPHELQESHSPTKSIKLKISADRKASKHQQRIVDARLWGSMTNSQQNAALAIDKAFHMMSKGLGYRNSAPHKIRTGSSHYNESDREGEIISTYFKWAKLCEKQNFQHSAAIDVLIYGLSCRQVDRNRKLRNGWSKKNLINCLNVYCKMKGWPV